MTIWIRWIFLLCMLISAKGFSIPSQNLQKENIQDIMEQILSQHLQQNKISREIIVSSFEHFINQFDPFRIYLLQEEVNPYLRLSASEADHILRQYANNDFSAYEQLNDLFQRSILRARAYRQEYEEKFLKGKLKAEPTEAVETLPRPFAKNVEQLKQRLRETLWDFLQAMQVRFGASLLKKQEKGFIAEYEALLRQRENLYLFQNSAGEPLPKAEEENLFALHILKALAQSLDRHTRFFSQEESEGFRMDLEKEYSGLGIIFEKRLDEVIVTDLVEGGPASQNGQIRKGDILLKINEVPIQDSNWKEMIGNLRGPPGTWVEMTFLRPDHGNISVRLQRQPISLASRDLETSYEAFGNGLIGIIAMNTFYRGEKGSSSQDIRKAIRELEKKGHLRGLILDLRNNTGGYLTEAVKVVGLFITNGIVVISREGEGEEKIFRDIDPHVAFQGPMIVLTSQDTASAGEIVAQALQDYGVAVVVGEEKTFGKGTVQSNTKMGMNGILHYSVTVGQYYTVSGKSPEGTGVAVDVVLPTLSRASEKREEIAQDSVGPEKIPPRYSDSLADISPARQSWYADYYLPTLQQKKIFWKEQIPLLRKNSTQRIANNKDYQIYLKGKPPMTSDEEEEEEMQLQTHHDYGEDDLLLSESVNILEDMILIESSLRQAGLKTASAATEESAASHEALGG